MVYNTQMSLNSMVYNKQMSLNSMVYYTQMSLNYMAYYTQMSLILHTKITQNMTAVEYGNNYQEQSTYHLMGGVFLWMRYQNFYLQLDEKLDLGRMAGPMKSKQSENADKGRTSKRSGEDSHSTHPFLLIFKILVCGKINSRNFTQMDGYLLLSFIQSLPKTAWGQMILLWPKRSLTWLQRDKREGSDGKKPGKLFGCCFGWNTSFFFLSMSDLENPCMWCTDM